MTISHLTMILLVSYNAFNDGGEGHPRKQKGLKMKYMVNDKEAKQLNKQGFEVVAGQIVDASQMPEWIQRRAAVNAEPMSEEIIAARKEAAAFNAECALPWNGSELKSLARALGRDRDPEVREMLSL